MNHSIIHLRFTFLLNLSQTLFIHSNRACTSPECGCSGRYLVHAAGFQLLSYSIKCYQRPHNASYFIVLSIYMYASRNMYVDTFMYAFIIVYLVVTKNMLLLRYLLFGRCTMLMLFAWKSFLNQWRSYSFSWSDTGTLSIQQGIVYVYV